jgi:hypothetical protein
MPIERYENDALNLGAPIAIRHRPMSRIGN